MSAARARVFFALALAGDALAEALRLLEALRHAPGAEHLRFVRGEGLHATLRFLGSVARTRIEPIAEAVRRALAGRPAFSVQLAAPHLFPSPRRPRVVALGLAPDAELSALVAAIETGVVSAGIAPEPRSFRAHVTLARVRDGARLDPSLLDGLAASPAARFEASEVVLFESVLAKGGSQYSPLARLPLHTSVSSAAHEGVPAPASHPHHS